MGTDKDPGVRRAEEGSRGLGGTYNTKEIGVAWSQGRPLRVSRSRAVGEGDGWSCAVLCDPCRASVDLDLARSVLRFKSLAPELGAREAIGDDKRLPKLLPRTARIAAPHRNYSGAEKAALVKAGCRYTRPYTHRKGARRGSRKRPQGDWLALCECHGTNKHLVVAGKAPRAVADGKAGTRVLSAPMRCRRCWRWRTFG